MDLFTEQEWVGEFFTEDQRDKRFVGQLKYSPYSGISLHYSISNKDLPLAADRVQGILSNGKICTLLLGKFNPALAGRHGNNGVHTRQGTAWFGVLLMGGFVKSDTKFSEIHFTATNIKQFLFPFVGKELMTINRQPILELPTKFGEVTLGQRATFGMLGEEIASHIYSSDDIAQDELQKAFDAVKDKYPKAAFMRKRDASYQVSLKFQPELSCEDALAWSADISSLFALLTYRPVYPESMYVFHGTKREEIKQFEVWPAFGLDRRTAEICKKEGYGAQLPITMHTVNLKPVLDAWLSEYKLHRTIISTLQSENGYRTEHAIHGEIVLFATQLESIALKDGIEKNQKYIYPISTYGSATINSNITVLFQRAGVTDIGVGVTDLRGEIAHVGRPPKILLKLSLKELGTLSTLLYLTVIGYILTRLGIDKSVVERYQDTFSPSV